MNIRELDLVPRRFASFARIPGPETGFDAAATWIVNQLKKKPEGLILEGVELLSIKKVQSDIEEVGYGLFIGRKNVCACDAEECFILMPAENAKQLRDENAGP